MRSVRRHNHLREDITPSTYSLRMDTSCGRSPYCQRMSLPNHLGDRRERVLSLRSYEGSSQDYPHELSGSLVERTVGVARLDRILHGKGIRAHGVRLIMPFEGNSEFLQKFSTLFL